MRGKLLIGAAGLASAFAAPAHAESYVQFSGGALVAGESELTLTYTGLGVASQGEDLDGGVVASAIVGEDFAAAGKSKIALEAEALYMSSDIETDDLDAALATGGFPPLDASFSMFGLLANARYDFYVTDMFSPYVGAGIGFGNISYSIQGDDEDDEDVIWQVLAGAVINVSPKAAVDIGYRYVELPEFGYSAAPVTLNLETTTQAISAGFRFRF